MTIQLIPTEREKLLARFSDLVDAAIAVDRSVLIEERDLLTRKWPGYAFMSPYEATLRFWACFRAAYRDYVWRNCDRLLADCVLAKATHLQPPKGKEFTQAWNARVRADRLGVKYEVYVAHAFAFAEKRTRQMPPWINQLEGGERARDAWLAGLEKAVAESEGIELGQVECNQYRLKNDCKLPAQRAFRERLAAHVLTTGNSLSRAIAGVCYRKRQLPLRVFLEIAARDVVLNAYRSIDRHDPFNMASPAPHLSEVDLMQSCLGVPGAADPSMEPCARCPQFALCSRFAERVEALVNRRSGSSDPRLAARRAGGALRTREFRKRQKAAALAAALENMRL